MGPARWKPCTSSSRRTARSRSIARARSSCSRTSRTAGFASVLERARQHSGALYLFIAIGIANVLGYGYQVVMARLLRPEEFAVLTALFGILVLESISSQVIQAATAKLAAEYRARDEEAALHSFVRRWSVRVGAGAATVGLLVVLLSGLLANA